MKLICTLFLVLPMCLFGQSGKEEAQEHLKRLKNGALLVRLPTSQNKIKAYIEAGQHAKAKKTARKQHLDNIRVYTAFTGAYKFSEVYFFYNLSSEDIRNGNLKGHLLNKNLEPDPELDYKGEFYIAEFDVIQPAGLTALVIKDRDFNFLQKPFPYYAKQFDIVPFFKRSKLEVVRVLNRGLTKQLKN